MSIRIRLRAMGATVAMSLVVVPIVGTLAEAPAHASSTVGGAITRSEILQRAQFWVDQQYTYNTNAEDPDPDGKMYRRDCSGLVSMAWHLNLSNGGYATNDFMSLAQAGNGMHDITLDELQPGDAVVKDDDGPGSGGHIELFAFWKDSDHHDGAYVYSFNNPNETVENPYAASNTGGKGFDSWADLNTYEAAIRYNNAVDGGLSGGGGTALAFQVNTGAMFNYSDAGGPNNTGYGMMGGTSPAITHLSNGDYVTVFQANTGFLYVYDPLTGGAHDTGYGMMSGTSPAIAHNGASWLAAFQANNGLLYTYSSSGGASSIGYGMKAGTSPSIAALSDGSYEIVFQANTGAFYFYNTVHGVGATGYGVLAGTSPSIAATGSGWVAAFQAATGFPDIYTSGGAVSSLGYGMKVGTSPSIAAQSDGTYELAFQVNTGAFYFYSSVSGVGVTGYGVAAGTSPSIVSTGSGWVAAFQAATGFPERYTSAGTVSTLPWGMMAGTSPSITS
jgi:hypothetical protein